MKKLLLVALILGAAARTASSQETYSISAGAGNVSDLTAVVDVSNAKTCERNSLAPTCTQAQVCTAVSAPGGASCTAAQARGANVRIFPNTQPGREEYVTFQIALPKFNEIKADILARGQQQLCKFWTTATQPQKDALCTSSGQAAGCLLCP